MKISWLSTALPFALAAVIVARGAGTAHAAPPRDVYAFDARPLRQDHKDAAAAACEWDALHLLASLQGLANRKSPRLYLLYCSEFGVQTDQFWLDAMRARGGWLQKSKVQSLPDIDAALRVFRQEFAGLVAYDERVPATSSAASTVAGVESLLPVRWSAAPGSLFQHLTRDLKIPVRRWLVRRDGGSLFDGKSALPDGAGPSSGSAKADVYRWALAKYLRGQKPLCDARFAAYYVDAHWLRSPTNGGPEMHTLPNYDYFIGRRAFFFDLSPWADEAPNDDASQVLGTDRAALLAILRALHEGSGGQVIKIGGFPPWPFKYTDRTGGRHGGVDTEWEFTRLISQFSAYHEADAANPGAIANASFWAHYPLAARYTQPNRKPTLADWRARGYVDAAGRVANKCFVAHYVGDYDSPSWLYKAVAAFFSDPRRGEVPLGWAFDPNLSDRAPQAMEYAYKHATRNDFFIAGDSGAGYLNPRSLTLRPDSGLPSGLVAWEEHNRRYFQKWGMSITGFVLDGAGGGSTDLEWSSYARFSPDGLGTMGNLPSALRAGVPAAGEQDLPDDNKQAAQFIARDAKGSDARPVFLWRRSILKSPTWYAQLSDELRQKYPEARVEVVNPYTFFGLLKMSLSAG